VASWGAQRRSSKNPCLHRRSSTCEREGEQRLQTGREQRTESREQRAESKVGTRGKRGKRGERETYTRLRPPVVGIPFGRV
jgi:hypothetical protein